MDKPNGRRGIRSTAMLLATALTLATSATLPIRAGGPPRQGEAGPAPLAKNLVGAWVLAEAETPGSPSGVGSRLKFFTGTHWMITQPDPETGEVIFHHGGRYTLDGDTLAGTIDFANESTATLIGQTHKFKISVDGDVYKQTGLDNPFTETWKRAK